jgi:hypothetical protein
MQRAHVLQKGKVFLPSGWGSREKQLFFVISGGSSWGRWSVRKREKLWICWWNLWEFDVFSSSFQEASTISKLCRSQLICDINFHHGETLQQLFHPLFISQLFLSDKFDIISHLPSTRRKQTAQPSSWCTFCSNFLPPFLPLEVMRWFCVFFQRFKHCLNHS